VQLGHAVGIRALEAHHGHHVAIKLAGLEGGLQRFLRIEHSRRRLDHRCSSATAETLITPRPRLPAISRSPSGENGADAGASTDSSPLVAGPARQRSTPSVMTGSSV
jgi:hypothetical protein